MQMLFMVGPYLQAELGWKMFTGLYFVSGVAANVAEYIGNVLIRCSSMHHPVLICRHLRGHVPLVISMVKWIDSTVMRPSTA